MRDRDLVDQMGGPRGRPPERLSDQKVGEIELDLFLHAERDLSVRVSETGEDRGSFWLPKSQIEIYRQGAEDRATDAGGQRTILPIVKVVMPEWLAREKGLI